MGKGRGEGQETVSERRPRADPTLAIWCPRWDVVSQGHTSEEQQSQDSTLGQFYQFFSQSLNMGANLSPHCRDIFTGLLWGPVVKTPPSNASDVGLVSGGELGSHMPGDQKTRTHNRSNTATNSRQILKIKNKKKGKDIFRLRD